ncbi:hypothetical protein, partial [Klebsiella pneumoniae]
KKRPNTIPVSASTHVFLLNIKQLIIKASKNRPEIAANTCTKFQILITFFVCIRGFIVDAHANYLCYQPINF